MSVYNCNCGAEAGFFCAEDQVHLCLSHKIQHPGHSLYFNQSFIKAKDKNSLINELKTLQKTCQASADQLQNLVEKVYNEINQVFQKEHEKIMNSLSSLQNILDILQSQEQFPVALNIFSKIMNNPKLLIESLKHRANLFINEKILKKIQNVVKFYSNVEDLIYESLEFDPPSDQLKEEMEAKYKVLKNANSFRLPSEDGLLGEWINSLSVMRNVDNFRALTIGGEEIDDESIDGYSLLPAVFFIRELALVKFETHQLELISKRVLSKCKHLNKVMFLECDIQELTIKAIKEALNQTHDLKEMIFNKCENGDILCSIPESLNLKYLTTLAFSAAMISDEGLEKISLLFPRMPSLKYLFLDSNSFGLQGSVYLIIYLPFLQELIEINLSNNKIGGCLGGIWKSLSKIKGIKTMNFSSTGAEESQLELIQASLSSFQYLESVYLDMSIQENFLRMMRSTLPSYTHIYRENSDDHVSFEFK
jgi:hypothetical protein